MDPGSTAGRGALSLAAGRSPSAPSELHQRCAARVRRQQAETFPVSPAVPARPRTRPRGQVLPAAGMRQAPRTRLHPPTPSRIIAVVGSSESGQEHVRRGADQRAAQPASAPPSTAPRWTWSATRPGPATKRSSRHFLYGQHRTLRRTDSIRALHALEPLIFMLRFPRRERLSGRDRSHRGHDGVLRHRRRGHPRRRPAGTARAGTSPRQTGSSSWSTRCRSRACARPSAA